jgi:hypothetical protein
MGDEHDRVMTLRSWLTLSLCCNALLAGVIAVASARRPEPETREGEAAGSTPAGGGSLPSVRPAAPVVVEVIEPFGWSQVESADYRVYMENLRGIRCPEPVIRRMIVAEVNAEYSRRVRDMVKEPVDTFWAILLERDAMVKLVEEKQNELKALDSERETLLQSLLKDPDPERSLRNERTMTSALAEFRQRLDFLTDAEFARVREITTRAQTARVELHEKFSESSEEFKTGIKELETREREELQAALSREQVEEMELRNSNASEVRRQLADFEATEAEVRAIAAAGSDPELQDAVRAQLGPERYAALQRSRDPAYQQALRITERFELSPGKAVEIYQVRREAEAMARAVREDGSRSVEERTALLESIREQTTRSLSGTLGDRAFKTYWNYAEWLREMNQGVKQGLK